jgi:hypothetical protein
MGKNKEIKYVIMESKTIGNHLGIVLLVFISTGRYKKDIFTDNV